MGWYRASHFSCERISAGWLPVGGHFRECAPAMEVSMVSRVGVSEDFRKQVLGYGLTTAQILYRMPDHPSLLQTYVWQNYDLCPRFPELFKFLAFWQQKLEGPLYSVQVAHSGLLRPAEIKAIDGVLRLH